MSLGHWCFGLHCHMFTRFWAHWVETCHCAEFRFWTEEASNWSTWRLFEFTERFFTQAITDPDHCPLSSSTTRSLQSTMATVTAATAGRTEQHSAVTDRGLTDFPLGRFNQLVANTLRVPALGYESVSATEMLAPTLPEFEAAEINDLLLVTQAVTAVRTHCETLKSTALSQDWLPSTAVPGSMTDGLYGIRYAIPSPDSPCNCFSLAALHSRRCQNWHALKNAETLFPNCKMPHSSYTLAEFNCYGKCGSETVEILIGLALKGDVVTTGQTAQSMCFATSLSTAKKILDTGFAQGRHCWDHYRSTGQVSLTHWMFRNRWHWSSTILDWRGTLPRPLFMDWRATGLTLKEKLKRTLTSTDCTWTTAGLLDHSNWVFSWTLRSPALDLGSYCPSLSRNWWSHCRWNWTATRSLVCTAEDWLATASSLWISWNWCMKMWALNVPGCTCSLMRNCQRKLEADWQLLMEKLALPRSMWRSLDCLLDLRKWLWLSLVTETEYTHVIFEATVFEHCYVDWCTDVLEVGSLKMPTCTLHHVWLTLFSWLQTVFFTDLQV